MEASIDFPWAPPGHSGRLRFGAPLEVVTAETLEQVVPGLERVAAAAATGRYAVGFMSYEAAPAFDAALRVRGGSGQPLLWFGLHDAPLPPEQERAPAAYACSQWRIRTDEARYAASVEAIRAAIARGDTYQVNHTAQLGARLDGDPFGAWADLRRAQRDGWFAYLDTGRHCIASVSPELFFTWDGHELVTRPMKGTRARSRDAAQDAALAADLRASTKDRAENLMIVDLLRNDLARVCRPGTVRVPRLFDVEGYPTVWQLTSTVAGEGRSGLGVVEIFAALFPCGSITGAPKARTMELIAELEDRPRGVYCGAVGVVFPGGAAAFNVAIRTLVVDRADRAELEGSAADPAGDPPSSRADVSPTHALQRHVGNARYDVGGGVVWDSDGRDEYAEALAKAAVLESTQRDFVLVETARVRNGRVWLEERHLDRMGASADWFGRPFDRVRARRMLRSASPAASADSRHTAAAEVDLRVRLLLSSSGELRVEASPLVEPPGMPPASLWPLAHGTLPPWIHADATQGILREVALAAVAVDSSDPWLRHKTSRRAAYRRALQTQSAPARDLFDVILHNERGEATELTIGNLVADLDDEFVTPPLSSGLLAGTLRAELLDAGVVRERILPVAHLSAARRLWLVNAVRGWVPIVLARTTRRH